MPNTDDEERRLVLVAHEHHAHEPSPCLDCPSCILSLSTPSLTTMWQHASRGASLPPLKAWAKSGHLRRPKAPSCARAMVGRSDNKQSNPPAIYVEDRSHVAT